jgi:hypothetical protein
MTIDMGALSDAAFTVQSRVLRISVLLTDIGVILENLALSWTGTASDDAAKASAEWTNVMAEVFDASTDPKNPAPGALEILSNGVLDAVHNYGCNDISIHDMFQTFWEHLTSAPTPPNPLPNNTTPVLDNTNPPDSSPQYMPYHNTAVNETF